MQRDLFQSVGREIESPAQTAKEFSLEIIKLPTNSFFESALYNHFRPL